MSKPFRWFLLVTFSFFFAIVIADALGLFKEVLPYEVYEFPTHTHYVPKDCNPPVSIHDAPQRPPGPNERINCQGQMVPK